MSRKKYVVLNGIYSAKLQNMFFIVQYVVDFVYDDIINIFGGIMT